MMYTLKLALKRTLRTVYFPVLLAILMAALLLAPMLGREEAMPTAGVCCLDDSEAATRMTAYLTQNGFEVCVGEASLRQGIETGKYGCGVIIPYGFEGMLEAQKIDGAVTFISSPDTYAADLFKGHVASAVFAEYAPYISADALEGSSITKEEMLDGYRAMLDSGVLFSFEVETKNAAASNDRGRTYILGAVSMLIFTMMMYTACDLLAGDIGNLTPRIGMSKTVKSAVLPTFAVRILLIALTSAAAGILQAVILGDTLILSLTPAIVAYTVISSAVALLSAAILADTSRMQIFTFYILMLSLVLCPVYLDVAMLIPWIQPIRYFVAPYLMWVCADGVIGYILALPLAAIAVAALYARFSKRGRNAVKA